MDAKCADERSSDHEAGPETVLEKTAVDSAYPAGCSDDRYVPVYDFWDFIIYFVVTGGVVLFTNIVQFDGKVKRILAVTAVQAVEIIVISYVVSLPFTLQFDSMFKGVGIAQNHSMIHQLLILWGLPVVLTVLLIICIIWEKLRGGANRSLYKLMKAISVPDLFAIVMGLCAIGLIVIPELVYVRDIYENGNARANTMFKLTYQAYMLFG